MQEECEVTHFGSNPNICVVGRPAENPLESINSRPAGWSQRLQAQHGPSPMPFVCHGACRVEGFCK